MTVPIIPGARQRSPADLTSPASPRPARTGSPRANSEAAQGHVLATASDPNALRNIKDVPPANLSNFFGDGTPVPPGPDGFDPDATAPATSAAEPAQTSAGGARQARKSSLVDMGALPQHAEQALSSMPNGSNAQLLAFALIRELGASITDAQKYACENIPRVPGKSDQQATLDYCLLRAAGLSKSDARTLGGDAGFSSDAQHFEEAGNHPDADSDPSVKINYCVLRATGSYEQTAANWANIGPAGGANFVRYSIDELKDLYEEQAKLELTPSTYPRFVGNSIRPLIPLENEGETFKGGFNEVEMVRIVDPRTNQERTFAFKPSKPDPKIGFGGKLTGIKQNEFFPESRNLAAVNVARTLGLTGEDGVTGDAFMGIVDGQLGLLMEKAPGKPMAQHHYKIKLDRNSTRYAILTHPFTKNLVLKNPAYNLNQCKILGVHSIRYDGDDVFLTGSVKDPKYPDTLEPFRNNDPSLKKSYARVEFFNELINEPDCHAGNMIVEEKSDGSYCARRIDLDQAFGVKSAISLAHKDSYMSYYLPAPARYIDKDLADRMRLPDTRAALEAAVSSTLYYADEVQAFLQRFDAMVAKINNGTIKVIDDSETDEGWRSADMTNPQTSLFARDGRRPEFALIYPANQ